MAAGPSAVSRHALHVYTRWVDGAALALIEALAAVLRSGERGALATVVRTGGSAPQVTGARLLLERSGRTSGTVGGGRVEQLVLEALQGCLAGDPPRTLAWDLTRDLGMCCGGRMEVFVEPVQGSPRLILFGAGHVACATARLARALDFRVTVVDLREELNSAERFPGCSRLLEAPDDAIDELALSDSDWLLIVTHDHALDQRVLEAVLRRPHRYIGMIGSRRKVLRVVERVRERRGELSLERLYAPVGLDLGAVGPEEIAVSVAAELVALRRSREVPHLRWLGKAGDSQQREPGAMVGAQPREPGAMLETPQRELARVVERDKHEPERAPAARALLRLAEESR